VTKINLVSRWPAALLASAAIVAIAPAAVAADAPPVAPAPPAIPAPPAMPAPPAPPDTANLDVQLEAARHQLEQAAQEVARLSAEMSGQLVQRVAPYFEPHAIIGVQLEPAAGGAGARVREVSPGGPAAAAGIRPGDVIVAVNGTSLKSEEPTRQVVRIMREVRPDTKVSVRVMRDGKAHEYLLTAREGPALFDLPDLPEVRGAFTFHRPLTDMELATLTPRLGGYFGTDKGVLVVRAPADGALQLEDGDVILAIDGREPTSGSHATRILSSYQPGEKIVLRVLRQHKTLQLETTLPQRSSPIRNEDPVRLEGSLRDDRELRQPRVLIYTGSDRT
jgi:predicted metalloprotease with PDZ domain